MNGHRNLSAATLFELPRYIGYFFTSFALFRNPFSVFYHYVIGSSPREKKVILRNGWAIHLSDHPHDIRTIFVVFLKKDYGLVSPGAVVLDFGANIGVFALYAAFCGAKQIYCFEPNQKNYDVLVRNIRRNGLEKVIHPRREAVTSAPAKTVKFPREPGPYNQILAEESESNDYEEVMATSLNAIMHDHSLDKVDLLKADCEGAEYDILLQAGESILSKIKAVKIEFHRWPIEDLLSHLKRHHFDCDRIDRKDAMLWMKK